MTSKPERSITSDDWAKLRDWVYDKFPPTQQRIPDYTRRQFENDISLRIPSFPNFSQENKDRMWDTAKSAIDYNTKSRWEKVGDAIKDAVKGAGEYVKDKWNSFKEMF